MKKINNLFIIIIAIIMLTAILGLSNDTYAAKISSFTGDVQVLKGETWSPVRIGQVVSDSQYINVPEECNVSFADGSSIYGPSFAVISEAAKGSGGKYSSKFGKMLNNSGGNTSTLGARAAEAPSMEDKMEAIASQKNTPASKAKKLIEGEKYGKALLELKKIKKDKLMPKEKADVYLMIATASYNLTKFKDVIDGCDKVLELNDIKDLPQYFQASILKSMAYGQLKKYNEAEKVLLEFNYQSQDDSKNAKNLASSFHYLGLIYLDMGDKEAARFCFEKIINKFNDYENINAIKENLALLNK